MINLNVKTEMWETQFEMSETRVSWLLENHIIEPDPDNSEEYILVNGPQRELAVMLLMIGENP